MEVLAGAGFAGVNGVVKAVTGKSILQHCGIAVNRLRANVLGIGAEYMGHALADKAADKAWKAAEAKLAGPDRDERLRFSCRLEALSDVLQSVASSRAVEGDFAPASGVGDGERSWRKIRRGEIRESLESLATEDSFKYDPYDSDSDQEASLLGEGSFGATHTMRNVDDGHLCAVKLIKIKKAGVPIESLRQEASRLAKLNHPNIVRYYVLHEEEVLRDHRRRQVKVSSKNAVGAELYRSPEKALGRAYDAKDDIWALGCMVAGAATGKSLEARRAAGVFALDARDGAKEKAAGALTNLASQNADNQVAIAKAGAVDPLVALLRTGTDGAKEHAAGALENLAFENADNKVAIAKAGAVDPLVDLLRTGTDGAKESAAGALWGLAFQNDDNELAIVKAGAADPLVALLRTGTDGAKEEAAAALANLAVNADNKVAIAKAGAVDPLVGLLRTGTAAPRRRRGALANLADGNAENKVAIAKAGAVDPLVALLRTGTDGARKLALALKNLASAAESSSGRAGLS
ncbi:serine/threonine kinase [Aureococcus anophagefferens]|nr:serine/threonine kinase [Aureococcus anophagefferens]